MVSEVKLTSSPVSPRIVFFGTPEFALTCLEYLVSKEHDVVAVVTQPDRPRGRGQKIEEPPVKFFSRTHGLRSLQPERLSNPEFLSTIKSLQPELGVIAAYGKILPQALLSLPKLGMINVHTSLLPKYRGAAPIQRAIIAGETETGVTIMRVVPELDSGPILATRSRKIGTDETSIQVERDLACLGGNLLLELLPALITGTLRETSQDERLATYAPMITKSDGLIDWNMTSFQIHNLVRGLYPWPHAYTFIGNTRLRLWRTNIDPLSLKNKNEKPGTVLKVTNDQIRIATGEGGEIIVLKIQAEGRRALSTRDFLSGHRIQPGMIFSTTLSR